MSHVRLATRGSPLALTQARGVAADVEARLGVTTELVIVKTTGDRLQSGPLAAHGGKGLFIKEIEEALLEGRADLAVHSSKDLPGEIAPGLVLAAFPPRVDPRDALVGPRPGTQLETLPQAARVGTGSLRRRSLLLAHRPDLRVVPLRGNVDTRLAKLVREGLDAVVLACAGLERLGFGERIHERLDPAWMLPAVGQGALALQVRVDDALANGIAALDDPATRAAVIAERAFLARLGGDCNVPIAGYAVVDALGSVQLRGLVASEDGKRIVAAEASAPVADAERAGRDAADAVLDQGAAALLPPRSAS